MIDHRIGKMEERKERNFWGACLRAPIKQENPTNDGKRMIPEPSWAAPSAPRGPTILHQPFLCFRDGGVAWRGVA